MERPRDYAYEALAEVTDAHMDANRGELNIALKLIKTQTELEGYELAAEIRDQATRYRAVMGAETLLTPNALAKHWTRVAHEALRPTGTNLSSHSADECPTCQGDRMVVVATRRPKQTRWMMEHGIEPADDPIEETAPCPDCNSMTVTMRRYDGQLIATPDPERVREMMRR